MERMNYNDYPMVTVVSLLHTCTYSVHRIWTEMGGGGNYTATYTYADLPKVYEIKAEDLPPFVKKNVDAGDTE